VPPAHLLLDRLAAVLAVVYLIFNEGYGGGRGDLAAEAIRLARAELMPGEPEVHGLLAHLHATRAELLRRLDRVEGARAAYDCALELVQSGAERRFLERRLAELQG